MKVVLTALCLVGLTLGVCRVLGVPGESYRYTPHPKTVAADEALRQALETGDYSGVKAALRPLFESESPELKRLSLAWIGKNEENLPEAVADALEDSFVDLNPKERLSRSLMETRAMRGFRRKPHEARMPFYREAIEKGGVEITTGVVLTRIAALWQVSEEGMVQFEPSLSRFESEINAIGTSVSVTADWRWAMRMRAGARDLGEALHLHAERLAKTPPEEFCRGMSEDPGCRWTSLELIRRVCARKESVGDCLLVGGLLDQVRADRRASELKLSDGAPREPMPDWLQESIARTMEVRVRRMEALQ